MGLHHKPGDPIPVTSSVGLLRRRSVVVVVNANGTPRTFNGVTKYYRTFTITTSYAGMVRNSPSPPISYTVTPAEDVYEYPRGWSATTTLLPSNTITTDADGDVVVTSTPEVWDPPLSSTPTFAAPTSTETETSFTQTFVANGSWSGTKTRTEVWSDEITKETLIETAETKFGAATFAPDDYAVLTGGGVTTGLAATPQFVYRQEFGDVQYTVVDYSLGTYTARPYASFLELLSYNIDSGPSEAQPEFKTTSLTDVETLPSGFFFSELFRDDQQHLFGDWFRVDLHDRFPDAEDITGSVAIVGLSGHKFVSESTGEALEDGGYSFLGSPFGDREDFFHSIGPATTP